VKAGVVSDVHNNVEALSYALDALRGCDVILNLGDLVSQYRVTPEIIRLARERGLLGILGNHEKTILAPCGATIRNQLAPADLAFLQALPDQRELSIDGRMVKVVHGSPWDDPNDIGCTYIYEQDGQSLRGLQTTAADVLLLGHTHIAMGMRLNGLLALNPGSCGEARDRAGRLSFAELDFAAGSATVFQIRTGSLPEAMLTMEM
jgi:putative phosphoesterase